HRGPAGELALARRRSRGNAGPDGRRSVSLRGRPQQKDPGDAGGLHVPAGARAAPSQARGDVLGVDPGDLSLLTRTLQARSTSTNTHPMSECTSWSTLPALATLAQPGPNRRPAWTSSPSRMNTNSGRS